MLCLQALRPDPPGEDLCGDCSDHIVAPVGVGCPVVASRGEYGSNSQRQHSFGGKDHNFFVHLVPLVIDPLQCLALAVPENVGVFAIELKVTQFTPSSLKAYLVPW